MAVAPKKCSCNLGYAVVAWVLFAVALYLLVGGFASQFQGLSTATVSIGWYFVGIVILFLGKMAKWKSHGTCTVHSGMHM